MDRASFRKELSRERSARGSSGSVLVAYFAVYFFMLAEPDRHCMQAFLLGAGLCPVAARGPLVAVRSLVAEYGLSGMQTSEAAARGLSHCLSRAPEQRLRSCGHGLSCSTAPGIFPGQGLNPCLLHCQADSSPLSHQGGPLNACFSFSSPLTRFSRDSSLLRIRKRSAKRRLKSREK